MYPANSYGVVLEATPQKSLYLAYHMHKQEGRGYYDSATNKKLLDKLKKMWYNVYCRVEKSGYLVSLMS